LAITSFRGLDKTVKFVSSKDDAIDHSRCSHNLSPEDEPLEGHECVYDDYFIDFDISKLAFIENMAPTVFHLRPLSPYDRGLVLDAARGKIHADRGVGIKYFYTRELVKASLVGIENLSEWRLKEGYVVPEGQRTPNEALELCPLEFKFETLHGGRFSRQVAADSIIDAIDPLAIEDVAAATAIISTPSPDQKKS
jgi:hypothetical protein